MSNNAANVSVGKPKVGGAVHVADTTATLPTTATEDLVSAFANLGYCSEDGLTNTTEIDSEEIKAWGGDVVEVTENGKVDSFKLTLIESMNVAVLKEVHGKDNVTGTDLATGIAVKVNSVAHEARAWVIDMIMKGNVLKRVVIPKGTITEQGDVVYKSDDVVGYEITIKAQADSSGNTHYEYLQTASSSDPDDPDDSDDP